MTLSNEVYATVNGPVALAVSKVLPLGFRGVIRISVDKSIVKPEDVTVEFRPPQPGKEKA